MGKNILNETDLKNVIIGATVVGAGGGMLGTLLGPNIQTQNDRSVRRICR